MVCICKLGKSTKFSKNFTKGFSIKIFFPKSCKQLKENKIVGKINQKPETRSSVLGAQVNKIHKTVTSCKNIIIILNYNYREMSITFNCITLPLQVISFVPTKLPNTFNIMSLQRER